MTGSLCTTCNTEQILVLSKKGRLKHLTELQTNARKKLVNNVNNSWLWRMHKIEVVNIEDHRAANIFNESDEK
jgi:hypothetical protein